MPPEVRWFESNHHNDEVSLLSEQDPSPKGERGEQIIVGVAQWTEKPIEMQISCGKRGPRQACQDMGNRASASYEPQKESELFIVATMWKKLKRPVNQHMYSKWSKEPVMRTGVERRRRFEPCHV